MTSIQPPSTPDQPHCANCDAPLDGPYCAACGQAEADLRQPILSLVTDFLDGAFAWDGRFLTTLRGLYLRPGGVARDYVDGKRMQFSPPMRIYLIMTLVFFALSAGASIRPLAITFTPDAATIRSQSAEDIEDRRARLGPRVDAAGDTVGAPPSPAASCPDPTRSRPMAAWSSPAIPASISVCSGAALRRNHAASTFKPSNASTPR